MDFKERHTKLRRIMSGSYVTRVELYKGNSPIKVKVVFHDPGLLLNQEADSVYSIAYEDGIATGLMTEKETEAILIKTGKWSKESQDKLDQLKENLEKIKSASKEATLDKIKDRQRKNLIEVTKEEIAKLLDKKNELYHSTAEGCAENARKRFLIGRITELDDKNLLNNPLNIELLNVCYYKESSLTEEMIREIARTEPWRTYWSLAKDTGTSLFPHSSVEMTDVQMVLIQWSKLYDFAFESTNRPSSEVIDDDYLFDKWYEKEVKRIEKELKSSTINKGDLKLKPNHTGYQELFVIANSDEEVKDIYEQNDNMSRRKIKNKHKFIQDKKMVHDSHLPDVRNQITMGRNRLTSKG